jgi:hypothetical protein
MIMKYLGLKLGPALKLCYHIDKLKQTKFWKRPEIIFFHKSVERSKQYISLTILHFIMSCVDDPNIQPCFFLIVIKVFILYDFSTDLEWTILSLWIVYPSHIM